MAKSLERREDPSLHFGPLGGEAAPLFVKPFRYVAARTVEEACATLEEHGPDAKVLAGGQSLIPMLNFGLVELAVVVDIGRVAGLDGLAQQNGSLRIGALTRHRDVERSNAVRASQPLLAEAVRHVGNPRVRNRGTLGGSLAHNDPAAELPLAMAVLGAEYEVSDGRRTRTLSATDFPVTYFTTQLAENELLISVAVPELGRGWGWGFHEFCRRTGDFAVVAAAAVARCEGDAIREVRVGLCGVADRAIRCRAFEGAVVGARVGDAPGLTDAVDGEIEPVSDTSASAGYRRHLARVLTARAVADACRRSRGEVAA